MITRKRTSKKSKTRSNFLNSAQRRELKRNLIDRYVKDFGLRNPGLVKEMVENFFRSKTEVNSKTIQALERSVKRAVIRGSSKEEKISQHEEREKEVESRQSNEHMEIANEDPMNALKTAVLGKIEQERRQKVVSGDLQLDYLDGILEEEMGLMSKNMERTRLKDYLEEQEKRIQNKTKILGQKMIRQELNIQKDEKEKRKNRRLEEEKKYENAIREKIREEEEEQRKEDIRREEQKKRTRKKQDKIIRERKEKLLAQKKREEEENEKIVEAIKEDLKYQKRVEEERFRVRKNVTYRS
jgi:hypothetical protein